jgi:hypothetical protein
MGVVDLGVIMVGGSIYPMGVVGLLGVVIMAGVGSIYLMGVVDLLYGCSSVMVGVTVCFLLPGKLK